VKYLIDDLQDRCADLWATVAVGYGLSPLEYIVELKLGAAGNGSAAIERPLVEYLRTTRKLDSDLTFLELQEQLERALNHEITMFLGRDLTEQLRELSVGSFLSLATGHTPIATRLSALYEEHKLKRGIDLFCGMPFEYVHIEDTGDVLPCCPSKFYISIGNLKKDTMHDVWTSRAAEAVRESIHDKTFRFCNYYACEYLKQGKNKHASE
jgi:radical SAM protein with 4Fe4S-binding SPASM domain